MRSILDYATAVIFRNPRRILVYLFGIILGVGLLSSVIFYVDNSASHMTATALQTLPVDMQVISSNPGSNLSSIRMTILAQPHVLSAERFDLASFDGSDLVRGNEKTRTSAGAIIAIQPQYLSTFSSIRLVQGNFEPQGVLISKDMATNLGAAPGDEITLMFPSPAPPLSVNVTGIVDLTGSDLLFAPTDSAHRDKPFNPPANVVIMDLGVFEKSLQPGLVNLSVAGGSSNGIVASNQSFVSQQIHVKIDHRGLPLDPGAAAALTATTARTIEKQSPGDLQVLNNMESTLNNVGSDLLWAQVIFIFLVIPGVILSGYLSSYAASTLIDSQRTELSLLRARGATPRQIVIIVGIVSLTTALAGAVIGLILGLLTNIIVAGAEILRPENIYLFLSSGLVILVAGIILAALTIFIPLNELYHEEINQGRQEFNRSGKRALWQRLYLDIVAIAIGIGVLLLTQNNGFQPVIGSEGQVTLSLSLYTLIAPLLIWLGAVLLFIRIGDRLLEDGTQLMRGALQRIFGAVGYFSARSISRRSRQLVQPALIIALALSFGISMGVFEQTYQHQQAVDAQLTLGADVVVTPARDVPQNTSLMEKLKTVSGVTSVSPFTKKVAYVGTELQDIFGVDAQTFLNTTDLSDSFFVGGTARQMMAKLETTPNGILISPEMAKDYDIATGDTVKIRLFDEKNNQYVTVPFQVVGVVREFSTAPKDSFLVANRAFLDQQIGTDNVSLFLLRTNQAPQDVARNIQTTYGTDTKIQVQSINEITAQLATTITSINLMNLTWIEWMYVIIISSLGMAIFLIGLLGNRKKEYCIMQAIGADAKQVNIFIIAEAGVSGLIGLIIGVIVGIPLAQVFITILTSIFDPPPSSLFIPWIDISMLIGLCTCGIACSILIAIRYAKRLQPATTLREL